MELPDMTMMCAMSTVQCTDQSIQQLPLFRPVNNGAIGNMMSGTVFTSTIDATAGGITPTESYVYAKFSDAGLTAVAVGDEDAFNSLDWDIAFRRYVIRLNSGVSGPSCVTGARTLPGTTFDSFTRGPLDVNLLALTFNAEQYFTGTCDFVPDGSGLGGPGTVLQSYWSYATCLTMTGNVYILQLASGQYVKLQVLDYYTPASQMQCDTLGTLPQPSGGANFTIEWAIL
jgi:HmuY protein